MRIVQVVCPPDSKGDWWMKTEDGVDHVVPGAVMATLPDYDHGKNWMGQAYPFDDRPDGVALKVAGEN